MTSVAFPEDTLFTSKAFVKGGTLISLLLTPKTVQWFVFPPTSSKGGCIPLYEVIAVRVLRIGSVQQPAIEVVHLPLKEPSNPSDGRRVVKRQLFILSKIEEANEWKDAIHSVMNGETIGVVPAQRRVLFVVNPVGGTKIAVPTFEKSIRPLLDLSGIKYDVIHTTHQNHAMEIAQGLSLTDYDAIVTVSGDGLLHEVVNGLLNRPDWPEAAKFPVGIIPCGSGNGLSKSFLVRDLNAAVLNIIKGHTRPLDIVSCYQASQKVRFGFLGVYWGLIADVDIESERFRWAGAARFTAAFVARVIKLRHYKGRLCYLPASASDDFSGATSSDAGSLVTSSASSSKLASEGKLPYSGLSVSNHGEASSGSSSAGADTASGSGASSSTQFGPTLKYLHADSKAGLPGPGENWQMIEGEFVAVLGLNLAWIDQTTLIAPFAHPHDGFIDLMYIKAPCSKTKLVSMFLDIESGKHVDNELVTYIKCRAFTLEPFGKGIMDVDGEQVLTSEIAVECHPSLGRLLSPPELDLPLLKNYAEYHQTKGYN